jgi:hypothetical protein
MFSVHRIILFLITIVGPLVQAQQPITPSSNCYIGNITQGFGYDTNFEETGRYRTTASPTGAVGTNRLVATVNRLIEVRTKNGTLLFRDSLVEFFSSIGTIPNVTIVFDPRVIYDEYEGRFIVLAHQYASGPDVSRLLLAVSKNETPDTMNAWNLFGFNSSVIVDGTSSYADLTNFEVDEDAIYITSGMFSFKSDSYTGSSLWIVNKGVTGGFYIGGTPSVLGPYDPSTQISGLSSRMTPAKVHGPGGVGGSIGTFLVSFFNSGITGTDVILVVAINNPLNNPPSFTGTFFDLGPLAQISTPLAPQNGSSTLIDTRYDTSLDAVWRNNKLYVTANFNPRSGVNTNQVTLYWVRFDTTGGTITLESQGFLGGESFSPGAHTYYPAIDVNQQGYVGFGYVASSPTLYVGAYGSLLSGAVEQPFTVKSGLDVYLRRSSSRAGVNSFGQYSSITVDPTDDSFWIYNQFADVRGSIDSNGDDGRWGTVWARVSCTTPV